MAARKSFNPNTYPYSKCRESHEWKFYDGTIDQKTGVGYRVQKCDNCDTKRYAYLSARPADRGQYVRKPRYKYPEDYKVEGGLDRVDLGRVRMHNFLSDLEGHGN